MSLILPLIGMAASAIGAGIQAGQNARAQRKAEDAYNRQRQMLSINPLDLVENKALLSRIDSSLNKQEEKIENQAAAGGATTENILAAKQAGNEVMSDVASNVLQGMHERRNQLFNLDSQRTAQQIAAMQQSGQNWANLASGISGSLTTLGGTMLENDIPLKDLFKFR